MTSPLPFEIWWKILEYLPSDACVIRLRTVNRLFLEIARTLRYRNLSINKYDVQTEHLLRGISSISLGHHIQSLCIRPWAISSASHIDGPVGHILSAFDLVRSFFDSDYPGRKAKNLVQIQMHEQIQLVSQTTKDLENVREYTVDWDVNESSCVQLFTAFLILPNISPLGPTLTKLTVRVPTDRLVCLATLCLPALEELNIDLVTLSLPEEYIDECLHHVIVFINNHGQNLRSLSISSDDLSQNLNLSTFFRSLSISPFLRLHSFTLSIPYDGCHLPEKTNGADCLRSFLEQSRSLRHLKLSSYPRAPYPDLSLISTSPSKTPGGYWIQRALEAPDLANALTSLTSLELAIRPLLSDLTPSLAFICAVAHQLESLVLTDEFLTPDEVRRVVDALASAPACSSLVHLTISLQYLSTSILNLFASRLGHLESLKLTFSAVKASSHPDEKKREISVKCESVGSIFFSP
ncbi:hypothetical protein GYMLUDRAFT_841643 [Collybiopsis luxurians FD-317 M1]|uniref:F-box domain-containing protein n=1 Tax=Collybiopsis luxurians FD-317 M1 TaxID=944289 RepID=A0A0D0BZF6_9AGAR|nr:hypothetical protein GYMLUDRAFT_841643 [Collybiopsis luxurians FD-317 M1]